MTSFSYASNWTKLFTINRNNIKLINIFKTAEELRVIVYFDGARLTKAVSHRADPKEITVYVDDANIYLSRFVIVFNKFMSSFYQSF